MRHLAPFVLLVACVPTLSTDTPAPRLTLQASWSVEDGCPDGARVVVTVGERSVSAACTTRLAVMVELDPDATEATASLVAADGTEQQRITRELTAAVDGFIAMGFSFTTTSAQGTVAVSFSVVCPAMAQVTLLVDGVAGTTVACEAGGMEVMLPAGAHALELRLTVGTEVLSTAMSTVTVAANMTVSEAFTFGCTETSGFVALSHELACATSGVTSVSYTVDAVEVAAVPCADADVIVAASAGARTLAAQFFAGVVPRGVVEHEVTVTACQTTAQSFTIDPCASGCLPGNSDLDGLPGTGFCGCEYVCTPSGAGDPIDAAFADSNCDGSDGVRSDCVYVDADSLVGSPDGTSAAPFVSIDDAIDAAELGTKKSVCIAGGAYSGPIALPPGINLIGGFDPTTWIRGVDSQTVISANGLAVSVMGTAAPTEIGGLTLRARTAGAGVNLYALLINVDGSDTVRVAACTLDTDDVPAAANGADGQAGAPVGGQASVVGAFGTLPSGCGMLPLDAGRGGDGLADTDGGTGFDAEGTPLASGGGIDCGTAGATGPTGSNGVTGNVGAIPSNDDQLSLATGLFVGTAGLSGVTGTTGGLGSGGGAGGSSSMCPDPGFIGGGGGPAGCGGNPGRPGGPGGAGGSAFALLTTQGTVVVDTCVMTPGNGGDGGDGGDGSTGGTGGSGGGGGAGTGAAGNGGPGGPGGRGGGGGAGSGGLGGHSICIGSGELDNVTSTALTCTTGTAGSGGQRGNGGPVSPSGVAAETREFAALP